MKFADTLEALSNAATVGQWRHVGRKGFDLDHTIITVEGQVVATLGDAIYHDSPNADLIVSLVNHTDDFVRLLRAAERKVANDPRRCAELAEALAAFEETPMTLAERKQTTECPPFEFDEKGWLIPIPYEDAGAHKMAHVATTLGQTWVMVCDRCGRIGYVGK